MPTALFTGKKTAGGKLRKRKAQSESR